MLLRLAIAAVTLPARAARFCRLAPVGGKRPAHVVHLLEAALLVAASVHLVAARIDEFPSPARAFRHTTSRAGSERSSRQPGSDLTSRLGAIAVSAHGTLGVTVIDVDSGTTAAVNDTDWYPMMSVYKLPIAIHVLRAARAGRLDLSARVTLAAEDRRPGLSPISRAIEAKGTQQFTIRELLSSMIRISDNAASDRVLRLAGGPAAVAATLRELELTGISVDRYELEFAADYYGICCVHKERPFSLDRFAAAVEKQSAAARTRAAASFAADRRDSAQPKGMAMLTARLVKGELLGNADSDWLIAEMGEMHTRDTRLRAGLPATTFAALRPGT